MWIATVVLYLYTTGTCTACHNIHELNSMGTWYRYRRTWPKILVLVIIVHMKFIVHAVTCFVPGTSTVPSLPAFHVATLP